MMQIPALRPAVRRALAGPLHAALLLACALPAQATEVCPAIRHEILTVKPERVDWTGAGLKIKPNDVILVYAGGRLTVGSDGTNTVSAKGLSDGTGALEMKVGSGTVVPVGTRWFGSFRDYGTLKFRVGGGRRGELAGSYQVNLVVIPAGAFPDTVTLEGE